MTDRDRVRGILGDAFEGKTAAPVFIDESGRRRRRLRRAGYAGGVVCAAYVGLVGAALTGGYDVPRVLFPSPEPPNQVVKPPWPGKGHEPGPVYDDTWQLRDRGQDSIAFTELAKTSGSMPAPAGMGVWPAQREGSPGGAGGTAPGGGGSASGGDDCPDPGSGGGGSSGGGSSSGGSSGGGTGVSASIGGGKVADAKVSVGGDSVADAKVSVGGGKVAEAKVSVGGDSVADAKVSVGGGKVAEVTASKGTKVKVSLLGGRQSDES